MTVDDIEADLHAALDTLIPEYQARPGLSNRVEGIAARRRRRRRAAAAVALSLALIVAGGLGLNSRLHGSSDASDITAAQATAPPVVDVSNPHLIVSPAVVPVSGAEIVIIAKNPTAQSLVNGVGGGIDRWNGSSWRHYRQFSSSLDDWGGTGSVHPLNEELDEPSIGLSVPAGSYGTKQWVQVSGLSAGYYRFSQDGLYGVLHVSVDAPVTPSSRPTGSVVLEGPSVVESGTPGEVVVTPALVDPQGRTDIAATLGGFKGPLRLEKLDGNSWVDTGFAGKAVEKRSARTQPLEFSVRLPSLPTGTYRMTRATAKIGNVQGIFWVVPPGS